MRIEKTPLEEMKRYGMPLVYISAWEKDNFINSHERFVNYLDFFYYQFYKREDNGIFLFRFYLELVARDFLLPSDKEIEEDICNTFYL